ncbi:discoidin domain-containing protein [Longispora sp. NPDC051575]|uniref:discoidin domain-containing protein n=1 Tax=Longispora sp. NPDC051575 TaxID=3154943 RepID=UPI00343D344A
MSRSRKVLTAALAAVALVTVSAVASSTASALPPGATYTVTAGSIGSYAFPNDTPASTYVDKDGTFYFQQAAALYGASDPRHWDFFTGTNFDTASKSSAISNAVNPNNANDKNNDTTWRCNNSPTGLGSTYAPSGSGYAQRNYCDLSGVWVDPDTGDWHGLVHNEFTPQPFGDGLHYDAIDHAVSTNQGRTWVIDNSVITSPYSTKRNDTAAFPNQTYDYGDGDQRLFVDTASGYFYALYGSRIVDKSGSWKAFYSHVARAPLSGKMAAGTWQKWYNGSWSQPGVGGKESNMVPVTAANPNGYTPTGSEYNPANTGTASQQIAAGKMPATSPLFVMNIAYNAYLGVYIGTPQAVDQSGNAPQEYYATDDLATQKWTRIGDSGSYHTASWYRWFLDSANKTNSTIVGKSFRSYCSFGCSGGSSSQYVTMSIDSNMPAPAPVDLSKTYTIGTGSGRVLAQVSGSSATTSVGTATGSNLEKWSFTATGDGAYRVTNASTGQALGVDSAVTTTRAWGTKPTVTASTGSVGQQWFLVKNTSGGTYRLVNRHSGLVLGLSTDSARLAETTPTRSWTNTTGNPVGGSRSAAEQTLTLTASGTSGGGRFPQSSMSVRSCDSQETTNEQAPCTNVLDGNTATFWHTKWSGTAAPMPHEIQIDLGASRSVTNLYYLPRQSQANGRIASYEVYVSADGTTWGTAVATGTFANNTVEQTVTFAAKTGRYVRLRALSEVNGNPWTAVAEINIAGV